MLFPLLWELNPVLPFLALLPSCIAILQIPKMVTLYTWVCYTEMLKVMTLSRNPMPSSAQMTDAYHKESLNHES